MKINHRLNAILIIGLTLGFGFTIAVVSAAPPITVTSAVPAEAEQGTTGLTVIINGRGFDPVMDVKFCRSETNKTCQGGGVDVTPGSVRFISSKQLEVTVDVDLEAVIGDFDIEAISLSSGRRGRGIEKFAVLIKGGGKSDTADCQIHFSVKFSAGNVIAGNVILGDGLGAYPDPLDSKDKSGGGTGSGPGFRFDTNGKMQVDTVRDRRWLEINPVQVPDFSMHMSGADFRFHLPFGGLDLCSLDATVSGEESGMMVPMILAFADDGGTEWALLYDCIFHDTNPIGTGFSDKAQVTRTVGNAGEWQSGDKWTITGTDACLISSHNYATATPILKIPDLPATFEMIITAE